MSVPGFRIDVPKPTGYTIDATEFYNSLRDRTNPRHIKPSPDALDLRPKEAPPSVDTKLMSWIDQKSDESFKTKGVVGAVKTTWEERAVEHPREADIFLYVDGGKKLASEEYTSFFTDLEVVKATVERIANRLDNELKKLQ